MAATVDSGRSRTLRARKAIASPAATPASIDHVLTARAAHAGAPAPRMRLVGVGVGDQLLCRILALHEVAERLAGEDEPRLRADQVGRALTQAARDRRGTLVMAARAAVARERRGGVDVEHVGVDRGLARAAGQVVHAVFRRPVPVELALDAIGERPVLRVAPPRGGAGRLRGERGRRGGDVEQPRQCERRAAALEERAAAQRAHPVTRRIDDAQPAPWSAGPSTR